MKSIKHLLGLPLVIFYVATFGQISNTTNTITLTLTNSDGCTIPASGSYQMNLSYVDLNTGSNVYYNGITVTVSAVNSITYTIDASGYTPAVNFPYNNGNDFINTTGSIQLTSAGVNRTMYWQYDFLTCSALPVTLTSFTESLQSGHVTLNWQTAMESNSSYFEVTRSTDGGYNFYKIGRVAAAGNSSTPLNYSFTDNIPGPANQYRLKTVDLDGQCAYSKVLLMNCSSCSASSSYPSPVSCSMSINGPGLICGSTPADYALSSPQPNYSNVIWSVSNGSGDAVTMHTCDNSKVSLTSNDYYLSTITLNATMSGCTNVISKNIITGYYPTGTYYNNGSSHPLYTDNEVHSGSTEITFHCPGCTNVQWQRTYGTAFYAVYPSSDGNIVDFYLSPNDYLELTVTGSAPCSDFNLYFDFGVSNSSFVASPNPAASTISVTQKTTTTAASKNAISPRQPIRQVQLYDDFGNLRKTVPGNGLVNRLDIDVSNLPTGYYLLRISYGNNKFETKHIRVQH